MHTGTRSLIPTHPLTHSLTHVHIHIYKYTTFWLHQKTKNIKEIAMQSDKLMHTS